MPQVDLPDEGSSQLLEGAKVQSAQALDQQARQGLAQAGFPASAYTVPQARTQMFAVGAGGAPGPSPDAQAPSNGPSADAIAQAPMPEDETPNVPPHPESVFSGMGSEVGNGIMKGFAGLARTLELAGSVPVGMAGDLYNVLWKGAPDDGSTTDAYFKAMDKYIDNAYQYWNPEHPEEHGAVARGAGMASSILPALTLGGAGTVALPVSAFANTAMDAIQDNQAANTAIKIGLLNAAANAAGMKAPALLKNYRLWARVLGGAGANVAIDEASQAATRKVLNDDGYKEAAARINLADPASITSSGIMGAIFGALTKANVLPANKNPGPSPEAQAPTPIVADENTPPPPLAAGATAAVNPSPAKPVQVPDHPTSEPLKDIQAQIADMQDPATARKAVYLSADNWQRFISNGGMDNESTGKLVKVPNFDRKGGMLLVPDKAAANAARELRRANPDDLQKVLGQLTGAGEGKTPDATVVVQGQTPEGAVASEGLVRPDEVPARVAEVQAEGKNPVVTTPEAAQVRRAEPDQAQGPSSEAQIPAAPAAPVEAPPAPVVEPIGKRAQTTKEEPVSAISANESAKPAPKEPLTHINESPGGMFKTRLAAALKAHERGEKVIPPEPVRGRSTVVPPVQEAQAPEKAAKESPQGGDTSVAESTNAQPDVKAGPEFGELNQALTHLERAEAKPAGKKFAGKVAERAGPISEFARALANAAVTAHEKGLAAADRVAAAVQAAKKVTNLDAKTPEAMTKNRGISHKMMDWHVQNLREAARGLMDPEYTPKPPEAPVKAEALKAKIAKKAVEPKEAPKPGEPDTGAMSPAELRIYKARQKVEAEKQQGESARGRTSDKSAATKEREQTANVSSREEPVKVIADVPDETKPRELTKGDILKIKAARDAYVHAEDEDAQSKHDALEKLIREKQPHLHPDDIEVAMADARAERRSLDEKTTRKSRDEEIADLLSEQRADAEGEIEDEHRGDRRGAGRILELLFHNPLEESGWNRAAEIAEKSGKHVSSTPFMQGIIRAMELNSETQHIARVARAIMRGVGYHVPLQFVDVVKNSRGELEPNTNGLHNYSPASGSRIQISFKRSIADGLHPAQVLLHEMVHAATSAFMRANPNHPYTLEMKKLWRIAKMRDIRMKQNLFEATDLDRYGLTNEHEFVAEALTSGQFQEFLHRSEMFKQPGEGLRSIINQFANVIRKMLGVAPGKDAALLDNVMDLTGKMFKLNEEVPVGEQVPDMHETWNHSVPPEANWEQNIHDIKLDALSGPAEHARVADAIENAMARGTRERRALINENGVRRFVGQKAGDTLRDFNASVRGRVPRILRQTILANETHDQIFRSNAHWFDEEGKTNPVRDMQRSEQEATKISNEILDRAGEIGKRRGRLGLKDDENLGDVQIYATSHKIDPTEPMEDQPEVAKNEPGFKNRYNDLVARFNRLSPEAQQIFHDERDFNQWAAERNRRAAIDASLGSYTDKEIPQSKREVLYQAIERNHQFGDMIGEGKFIDVGDRNKSLVESLKNMAGLNVAEGPYFHLGRHGDLVVQVKPEGSRDFASKDQAESFAQQIRDLSPRSEAKVAEVGGKWNVDYKADYVSMHASPAEAEAHAEALRRQGLDVGPVTEKIFSEGSVPHTSGVQSILGEATRRLARQGVEGEEAEALVGAMRRAFVQSLAARSAYAASKLARKATGGVKPGEMGRNFAEHAQSVAWNTAHLATTFDKGEALGRIRQMAKEPPNQAVAYKRGAFMRELGKRMTQDVAQQSQKPGALNRGIAKVGFLNFLASASHAGIWMTQNFTTAIPVAGGRWGYGKTIPAFTKAMRVVGGPALRQGLAEHFKLGSFDAHSIIDEVVKAVKKDPALGKWAQGSNSHLKQLMERGLVQSSFAQELSNMSHGGNRTVDRIFDYARLAPHMADVFNRVSTGLAGLEMTGGDIAKSLDFVKETHMDYGAGNKSRVFKAVGRVPGLNSMTMFRTYTQGMFHLLYSNIKNMVYAESKSRGEAAKTVAGMVLAMSLAAGMIKGAVLEPVRLAVYAYNKLFGDDNEYHDLDNTIRRVVSDMVGKGKAAEVITGGLPRLFGFDLSSRMGLSDLLLHDPPDLLGSDTDKTMQFLGSMLGPMPQGITQNWHEAHEAWINGHPAEAFAAMLPIKAVHDSMKAWAYYTTGKQSALGAKLTEPSAGAALSQALGYKPAAVAEQQERSGTVRGYNQWEDARKFELIKQYMNSDDSRRGSVVEQMRDFNSKNPGHRITVADIVRAKRTNIKAENSARGQVPRDPTATKLIDY